MAIPTQDTARKRRLGVLIVGQSCRETLTSLHGPFHFGE
jgi:hypothetical protein